MTRTDAQGVFEQYSSGVAFNQSIDLYKQVDMNENFYIGKQWEGLNAPDLDKPVINVLRRVVSYFISMIVADDVSVSFTPFEGDDSLCKLLQAETDRAIEHTGLKDLSRDVIRNAAVDGDGCLYFYYDPDGAGGKGSIASEVLDNTSIIFGMTEIGRAHV